MLGTSTMGRVAAAVAASPFNSHPPKSLCGHWVSLLPAHSFFIPHKGLIYPAFVAQGEIHLEKVRIFFRRGRVPLWSPPVPSKGSFTHRDISSADTSQNMRGTPPHFPILVPPVLYMELKSTHYTFLVHHCRESLFTWVVPTAEGSPFLLEHM